MRSLPASLDLRGIAFLRSRRSPAPHADNAGRGASILGVGHFTIPPDAVVKGPDGLPANGIVTEPGSTIRTIVVPHGIAGVPRRSPIKARKRTPWRAASAPHGVVERGGCSEWFTDDRVFVKSKQRHLPAAFSTSAVVHVVLLILVLVLLGARAARADLTPRSRTDVSLPMPAMVSQLLVAVAPSPAQKAVERPSPVTPARPASPLAQRLETPAAAPLETPSSIEAEPTSLDAAAIASAVVSGTADGVAGGVAGGTGSGLAVEPANPPAAAGPFRVGEGGIERPRKTKDVRPVYPPPAMAARIGGNILIEATIGADGKVHNARVLQSVALLDQAALDAVRQWEFAPSQLNGVAVAVMMVIVVTFTLL